MSALGPHLNKLGKNWVVAATYQDSASKLSWFWHMSMAAILLNDPWPHYKFPIPLWQKAPHEKKKKKKKKKR